MVPPMDPLPLLRAKRTGRSALLGGGRFAAVLALALALTSAWSARAGAEDAIIRPLNAHQRITGFGASSAWTGGGMSDADADLLFSTDSGIGLSLLRVRIAPDGSCLELATAGKAQARGAQVWASPWSPPAAWKSNGDVNNGGTLLPEHADDWAKTMVTFVSSMQAAGVTIRALSAQNEPTMKVNYESCVYTPAQLADFTTQHLRPALDAAGLSLPIVAPETVGWGDLPNFSAAILSDPNSAAAVGIMATHAYSGVPGEMPDFAQAGKEFWQTEIYDKVSVVDAGIGSALRVAININAALTRADVNAWHYWWIYPSSGNRPDNSALWDLTTKQPAKRLYALGNFSRFVRPGFYRVEAPLSPTAGLALSAFYEPASGAIVIVVINQSGAPVSQTFRFDSLSTGSWQAWVTSDQSDLAPGLPVTSGASVSYTFGAQSITTLQGLVTGAGPAITNGTDSASQAGDSGGCACTTARHAELGSLRALRVAAATLLGLFLLGRRRAAGDAARNHHCH